MPNWSPAGQQQQQQQQVLSQSGAVWEAEAAGSRVNDGRKRSHDTMTAGQGTSAVLFDDKGRSISEKREAAQKRLRASLARRGIPFGAA